MGSMMDEHDRYWLDVAIGMITALAVLFSAALAVYGLTIFVWKLGQGTI
jgi:hypothetical protein